MNWYDHLHDILLPRYSYQWIAGGALWLAWFASIMLGTGNLDVTQEIIGADYLQFYCAGLTLLSEASARLYDFTFQAELQQGIGGSNLNHFHAYLNPPLFALLFAPLSLLPYLLSFALWSSISLVLLYGSIELLGAAKPKRTTLQVLAWYPAFAAVAFGQNSLITLAILSLVYRQWRNGHHLSCGVTSSLLFYKPYLLSGLVLLWLLERRKDLATLIGLGLGSSGLLALSLLILPKAHPPFLNLVRNTLPEMLTWQDFPLHHAQQLRAFFFMTLRWLPSDVSLTIADCAALLASASAGFLFYRFWQLHRRSKDLLFAGAIILTVVISPHTMIYDWVLLIIPATIFYSSRPDLARSWGVLFSCIWVATYLNSPLMHTMLKTLPFALPTTVPIFIFVVWQSIRLLSLPPPPLHKGRVGVVS